MSEESDIRLEKVRELIREKGADAWPGGSDNTANVLGERRELSGPMSDDDAHREMSRRSRRVSDRRPCGGGRYRRLAMDT